MIYDVAIIGGGIAGITSAIYCHRAGLKCVIFEKKAYGGQIMIADVIENYPGFDEVTGYELSGKLAAQLENTDITRAFEEVVSFDFDDKFKKLYTRKGSYMTKSVIICTGSRAKRAGFLGEEKYIGRGISYCATCDGFFYREKDVFVIGGGNSAISEALYLSNIAKSVTVIIRGDKVKSSRSLYDKLLSKENVSIVYNTELVMVTGNEAINKIVLKNKLNNRIYECNTDNSFGIFVFAGYSPNTEIFRNSLNLDKNGYIITDNCCRTNLSGVFAGGDVRSKALRQIVTAASDGAVAASMSERYISDTFH